MICLSFVCGSFGYKERRQSRDMETITEQEYLTGTGTGSQSVATNSDKMTKEPATDATADEDDPFLGTWHVLTTYSCSCNFMNIFNF